MLRNIFALHINFHSARHFVLCWFWYYRKEKVVIPPCAVQNIERIEQQKYYMLQTKWFSRDLSPTEISEGFRILQPPPSLLLQACFNMTDGKLYTIHYARGFVMPCFSCELLNTLRPRQNGRRFADDTFKRIFVNENVRISIKISLLFVPKCPINNIPAFSIGSDNGLAPVRRQAIIWTNDG